MGGYIDSKVAKRERWVEKLRDRWLDRKTGGYIERKAAK